MGRSNSSSLIFRRAKCISGRGHPRNFEIKKKIKDNFAKGISMHAKN